MILARHQGPECERRLRPEATQAAWDELGDGEGEGLCWSSGNCADLRTEEIARLRAALSKINDVREAVLALPRYRANLVPLGNPPVLTELQKDPRGRAVLLADVLAALEGA